MADGVPRPPAPIIRTLADFSLALAFEADLGHDEVAAVARELPAGEGDPLVVLLVVRRGVRPSRDRRDYHQGVPVLELGALALLVPDVLLVEVDVDEVPQSPALRVEVPPQVGEGGNELLQGVADRPRVELELVLVVGVLPQRRRDDYRDGHAFWLTPLSSTIPSRISMASSATELWSSLGSHDLVSPASPFGTETTT